MITAIIAIGLLAAAFGLLLGYAAVRFRVQSDPLVNKIEAVLPQTQCGQCGYAGCHPYAEAIATGEADINRCPPGGEQVIRALADLLDRDAKPLDQEVGEATEKAVAFVDEALCIGCTKCIQACPVDAILGAPKLMHTVIETECTGCKLCVPVCPVDCVYMVPVKEDIDQWTWPYPETSPEPSKKKGVAHG